MGLPGAQGSQGERGATGEPGRNGLPGTPGRDGTSPDLATIVDAVLARIVELGKTPTDIADDARRADIEATKQRAREMREFLAKR